MAKKSQGITLELRRVIAQAQRQGQTLYQIAKAAGMRDAQIGRIAKGETEPLISTADRVLRGLGYKLAIVPILAK